MLPYLLPLAPFALLLARELWRRPTLPRLLGAAASGMGIVALLWALGVAKGDLTIFGLMSLTCAWLFLGLPALGLVVMAQARGAVRLAGGLGAVALLLIGARAFLYEPHAIEVSSLTIASPEVTAPLRIVLLADVQTDHVGADEARAFALAAAARPDLVVFTGDHVQLPQGPDFQREAAAHARALQDSGLSAPLGMFAVEGDVDPAGWPAVFEGTEVRALPRSQTLDLGPLTLTALSPDDSRSPAPPVPAVDGLHVLIGHSPDFALARPPADLLLAGHTHGGQIVLPFFGPPMTLTKVPRAWASGHTKLPWGGDLVVSRGVGLERRDAPRVRLLCRPEVVVIDVVPAGDTGQAVAGPG